MSVVEEAVAAIQGGQVVVLPTDTVYGICADAYHEAPARRLARECTGGGEGDRIDQHRR